MYRIYVHIDHNLYCLESKILKKIWNGMQCSSGTLDGAREIHNEYLKMAKAVMEPQIIYGVIYVIQTTDMVPVEFTILHKW